MPSYLSGWLDLVDPNARETMRLRHERSSDSHRFKDAFSDSFRRLLGSGRERGRGRGRGRRREGKYRLVGSLPRCFKQLPHLLPSRFEETRGRLRILVSPLFSTIFGLAPSGAPDGPYATFRFPLRNSSSPLASISPLDLQNRPQLNSFLP